MRGGLFKQGENKTNEKVAADIYIPRAHVQFLEQSGVKVIAVDYRMERDELEKLFDQLNGLYVPGDSYMTQQDEKYKFAFMLMLEYCEKKADVKDHFPIFMMGNSMQLLVRSRKVGQKTLESMEKLQYKNLMIKMVDNLHPSNTYIFDRMTRDERQAVFNAGKFFNS